MKILVAHESLDTSGGVESYLSSLLPGLVNRGHAIALLYHRRRESGRPMTLPADPCIGVDSLGLERAFDAVRAWRPDVCFSHNMGALEIEERLVREWPVVKMMHGYFGTCASGATSISSRCSISLLEKNDETTLANEFVMTAIMMRPGAMNVM